MKALATKIKGLGALYSTSRWAAGDLANRLVAPPTDSICEVHVRDSQSPLANLHVYCGKHLLRFVRCCTCTIATP